MDRWPHLHAVKLHLQRLILLDARALGVLHRKGLRVAPDAADAENRSGRQKNQVNETRAFAHFS